MTIPNYQDLLTRQDDIFSSTRSPNDDYNGFCLPSSLSSDSFSIPSSSQSSSSVSTAQEIQIMRRQLNEIQRILTMLVERDNHGMQSGGLPATTQRTSVSLFSSLQTPRRVVHHPRQSDIAINGSLRKAQFSWKLMEWLVDHVARTQLNTVLNPQGLEDTCNNVKGNLIAGVQDDIRFTFNISEGV